jgi:predicted pyridoxine 5'-phosphate oxidase superfamily flavin-nucleotide-binding protein
LLRPVGLIFNTDAVKAIDERSIAFGDFRGNRQYVSTGNLITDNRVGLILVAYPRPLHLNIMGRVEVLEESKRGSGFRDPEYKYT